MAIDEKTQNIMDAAADAAAEKLAELEDKPELAPGIKALERWWTQNRLGAGHRRLYKILAGRWP